MNNSSYTYNKTINNSISHFYFKMYEIEIIIDILILCDGLLVICLAIYGLYRMVRSDMVVPIYIINLLIVDLLQIIVRPVFIVLYFKRSYSFEDAMADFVSHVIFHGGLCASVWFMVCISLERYLVVAHPLWYRCHHTVKHAILISVGVWVMTLIFMAMCSLDFIGYMFEYAFYILSIILSLLPFPLLVFFFVGTWRAIAGAISVRYMEKRRILLTLAFVLGTYTLLFLPLCIVLISFVSKYRNIIIASFVTYQIIKLNALVDPVLYILLRPDFRNTLRSLPCCQRLFTMTNCWTPRAEQEEREHMPTLSLTVTNV